MLSKKFKNDNKDRARINLENLQRQHKEQIAQSKIRARKLVKFLISKIFVYSLLLLIQIILIITGFSLLTGYVDSSVFIIISGILSVVFSIHIINSQTPNEYKIVWLFVVSSLTVFGMVTYLLFRKKEASRKIRRRTVESLTTTQEFVQSNILSDNQFVEKTSKFIEKNCCLPLQYSDVVYFSTGEEYLKCLKEELEKANSFVFLEYFIISSGEIWREIFEILKRKGNQGLDIRIIYDDLGCLSTLEKDFKKNCRDNKIKVYNFNKLRPVLDVAQNNRTHRKIALIDGVTAFTGGVNLADEYANLISRFGYWKDSGVMLKGNAVKNFTAMFLTAWTIGFGEEKHDCFFPKMFEKGGSLCQPFFDMPGFTKPICEEVYLRLIYEAKISICITTPYLIISEKMGDALIGAAESGVDVRIVVPHVPDKKTVFELTKAFYTPLVIGGVKVFEYKPGFIHSKSIVVDDEYAVIGTTNMDFRSLYLHHECNVFIHNSICPVMKQDFEETINKSLLITEVNTRVNRLSIRIWRALLRIFAPLM